MVQVPARMEPVLSKKARNGVENLNPLVVRLLSLFGDQYSKENPDGIVSFGVAENTIMTNEVIKIYHEKFQLEPWDLTYGTSLTGSKRLYTALSKFLNDYFKPFTPVENDHMIAGVGCGAVIDQITEMICDEGDSVLCAEPFYNGFEADVAARCNAQVIGVPTLTNVKDPGSAETVALFEQKYKELIDQGGPTPKGVILCNPNNPMGFCYTREALIEYCKFAEKYNLHLIVDEIYALSVFKNSEISNPRPFISMLNINSIAEANCDPSRIHVIYGMSKDFCANGFRIGVLITQHNPILRKAFIRTAMLMKTANPADACWSGLLNDRPKLDWYINELQTRLSDTIEHVQSKFKSLGIPFVPSYAGHFMMIDLNKYLPTHDKDGNKLESDLDREIALFLALLEDKVYIAPGISYHYPTRGWYRFTFTVDRATMDVGFDRLEKGLKKIQHYNNSSVNGASIESVEEGIKNL